MCDKETIKYVGFYDVDEYSHENRLYFLSAVNKMNYICNAINDAGYDVNIISPSWSQNINGFYKKHEFKKDIRNTVTVCPSFGTPNGIILKLSVYFCWAWLFLYLLFNTDKNEKVIVYHSPWLAVPVLLAKRIRCFHLILEVEEIYQRATPLKSHLIKRENKLLSKADSYIFSTELLREKHFNNNKDYAICYGAYRCFKSDAEISKSHKIHIVYAGIIDMYKQGAFNAVECANYLDDNYVIHIIGFGDKNDIAKLQEKIDQVNKKSGCRVVYDFEKRGREYNKYLNNCDIGLSTQKPDGEYLDCSFPSKILSYLGHGLRVVSAEIDCVKRSAVGDKIYYYKDSPANIAMVVQSIDFHDEYDSQEILNELHRKFVQGIRNLLTV